MFLFALLICVVAAFAPGAWAAFTLGREASAPVRAALAVALSPFVLGAQIWALSLLGLGFQVAAFGAMLVNLPALWLVWRARASLRVGFEARAAVLCFAVLALALTALWLGAPGLRTYSWHNMMQMEAVYQAARLPAAPEEMGLAGVRLNYAWFGHIQIAAIARLGDVSPLVVFPLLNLAALLAFLLLTAQAARILQPGRPTAAALVAAALLLTPNLAGIALHYLGMFGGAGDIRTSTPVHKFLHFDLMSVGFALFAATLVLSIQRLEARTWREDALLILTLTGLALIYPLLAPAALVIAGCALVAGPVAAWWAGRGFRVALNDVGLGAALLIPILIGVLYLRVLNDGGAASVAIGVAEPWEMRRRLFDGVLRAGGAWLPLLAFATWRVWRMRDGKRLALLAAGGVLVVLYLALELPLQVQYKFLVAALLCVLPLATEQVVLWLSPLGGRAVRAAAAGFVLMVAFVAPHILQQHVPWQVRGAPQLEEDHADLAVDAQSAQAWTNVVRARAPREAVVVRPPMDAPIEVLTQRPAYVALGVAARRPGYGMLSSEMLVDVKGYPPETLARREGLVRACYEREEEASCAALLADAAALNRPIVAYAPRASMLDTLLQARAAAELYADEGAGVWLLGAD